MLPVSGAGTGFSNDAVAGTVVQVKAAQATIYWLKLVNTTAATAYLQVFGLPSASVTLGTTVAAYFIRLTANETLSLTIPPGMGIPGSTGLTIAGTTSATNSTGAAISVTMAYV